MTRTQHVDYRSGYRTARMGRRKPWANIWVKAGWHDYHIEHNTGVYE